MRTFAVLKHFILGLLLVSLTGCTSSDTGVIDKLLGNFSSLPILTSIPDQTVSQEDLLSLDVNNIKEGLPGNDKDISYTCVYDTQVDGQVATTQSCKDIPNSTVSFEASTGILQWTPHTGALGNYEIKITGTNEEGSYDEIFTVGVRLKFSGIGLYTLITGNSVTATWTPNPAAQGYQVFKLNSLSGQYETLQTVTGGSASGTTITGLVPNTPYTLRVQAIDALGNFDGNVVSRSFTTTELVRLSMSAPVTSLTAGSATTITIQAYNANGTPQTIGGLPVVPSIASGTSSGTFSAVTDHDNGTYSFSFTPTVVGSAIAIDVSINITFHLNNTVNLSILPGAASSANSAISISSGSVISGNSATVTATLRDAYNNPISSGAAILFTKTGGTSSGVFSAVVNQGNGVYSVTYSGITAGTAQTLAVQVDGVSLSPTTTIQVLPGTPVSANSTLTISSSSISSGSAATVTATLKDLNNNPVPSGVMVVFNKGGGTSSGILDSIVNAGNGVYTTTYTGVTAGTAQTLSVSVDGVTLIPTVTVAVVPGPALLANSSLSVSSPTVISGAFVTVTATLKDLNNNPIDTGVTVSFTKTGGTSTGDFNAVTNQGNGVYNIRYTGLTAGTAQTLTVLIDGAPLGTSVDVTVLTGAPAAAQSSISISDGNVISGQSVTVTATIKDENNNPVTSGVSVSFSKSGGTSTGTFGAVTHQGSGVYTVSYTGILAGTAQSIHVLVDGFALGPNTTVTVTPGAPSNGLSTLTISASTVIAAQYVTLTATIKDAQGNPISSGILVNFDKSGGTSFGNFSGVTNQGNGVYTATYTGVTAGTAQTVQANVNGAGFGPTQNIQVLVGAPSLAQSSLSVSSSTVASDSSVTITGVVRDSQNNPITSEYSITFDSIGGSSTGTISSVNNAGNGTFTATYTGLIAGSAQTLRVLADGTPIAGLTTTVQVIAGPASAANSSFSIGASNVQSGTATTLSMNLRDANSNAITSGAAVSFSKSTGVSDGTISAVSNLGSGNYSATYTGTTMGPTQTIQLVVNAVNVGLSVSVTVSAGPPTHLTVAQPANPLGSIDCNGPYTLTLKDNNENTTTSLSAVTLNFSSAPAGGDSGTIFSDSSCASPLTSLGIPALTSSALFYYKSYVPNSFTLTLTPGTGSIDPADITITNIPVLAWIGGSSLFTMNGSGSNTVMDNASGGFWTPYDMAISGDFMYVVDNSAHRVLKYKISTSEFIGWIGYVASTEGLVAADGGIGCTGLAINALTPTWCQGGRASTSVSASTVLHTPRNIAADDTYIYVSNYGNHRVSRFLKSDGSFQGWIGKIGATKATDPQSCFDAGTNVTTPTWCTGGTSVVGTDDGQFTNPAGIAVQGTKLYVIEYSSHRLNKFSAASGAFEGWVGRVNTAPPALGQLATCAAVPATNDATPGWCLGGTSKISQRRQQSVAGPPSEVAAPAEGFYNPSGITADSNYLYVADGNNYRIARLSLTTGAFAGWIGYLYRSSILSPTTPAQTSGNYTSAWTSGGVTGDRTSNGWGYAYSVTVDEISGVLYIADSYHRVSKVQASDGQDFRWIGRAGASPTGGFTGCSSTPVSGTNPGWCLNGAGNRYGNTNGTFYTPTGVAISSTKLYVADLNNHRIQRFDLTEGFFDGWIGGKNTVATTWSRTLAAGTTAARAGIGDSSFGDIGANYAGVAMNSSHMFVTDPGWHRIKKYNRGDGSFVGYIGQIQNNGGFYPTGPESCVGYTSGMTPDWCSGGGRTTTGTGIHGYNSPYSVAADTSYIYIANYSNNRIDRVRISDALYLGWIGEVATTPTDGDPACLTTNAPDSTPNWCIGGTAGAGVINGTFTNPRALYYDSDASTLYAIDGTSRIMKINPANGSFTGLIGGMTNGTGCTVTNNVAEGWCSSATGNAGTSRHGGLSAASALAMDSIYIYVADTANHRIARFHKADGTPSGFIAKLSNATNINTTAGGGACNGLTAGYPRVTPGWCWTNTLGQTMNLAAAADEGAFSSPRGVWADSGYIYVADTGNNRLVRIAPDGSFAGWKGRIASTTGMSDADCLAAGAAGGVTPKWCYGGSAGPGLQLGAFTHPAAVTGDDHYLYVFDGHNNRLQSIPK